MDLQPPRFEDAPGMLMAGIRRHHAFATAAETVPEQWREMRAGGSLPGRVGSVAYGVICEGDAEGFEYLTAHQVGSFDALPEGTGRMRIPPQRYAVFTHQGTAAKLSEVWQAIWSEWLPTSGYEDAHTPAFERYDERFDPRAQSGVMEVCFPITPADQRESS